MKKLLCLLLALFIPTICLADGVFAPLKVGYRLIDNQMITAYIPEVSNSQKKLDDKINAIIAADSDKAISVWAKSWDTLQQAAPVDTRSGLHLWVTYQTNYNRENIFSVLVTQSAYMGGAHPSDNYFAYNIDCYTGQTIQLADLFAKDNDWQTMLTSFVKSEIKLYNYDTTFEKVSANQMFYLSNEGLVLYFNPATIAPRYYGIMKFVIPYRVISFAFSEKFDGRIY